MDRSTLNAPPAPAASPAPGVNTVTLSGGRASRYVEGCAAAGEAAASTLAAAAASAPMAASALRPRRLGRAGLLIECIGLSWGGCDGRLARLPSTVAVLAARRYRANP